MAVIDFKKVGPQVWNLLIWALSLFWGLMLFVQAAYPKLVSDEAYVARFAEFGYPPWFHLPTGVWEAVGSVLLLYPRVAAWGAGMLVVDLLGAITTHLVTGVGSPYHAARALVFVAVIGWARRKDALGLSSR